MAGKVRVKRDSKGRYAGSYGGGGGSNRLVRTQGRSRLSRAKTNNSRPARPQSRVDKGKTIQGGQKQKQGLSKNQKRLIGAGVVVGVGVGAKYGVSKVLPNQTFVKSKKTLGGVQTFVQPDKHTKLSSVMGPAGTTFTTHSGIEGKGLKRMTMTNTVISNKKGDVIGIMGSKRSRFSRTNIVYSSYLQPTSRKKGIGGAALTAHAAHDPRRKHRASMQRSVQGQAFASSFKKAGKRTSKSKQQGDLLTRQMNAQFKTEKHDYKMALGGYKETLSGGVIRDVNAMKRKRARVSSGTRVK